MLPLLHDFDGERVFVVRGGPVAAWLRRIDPALVVVATGGTSPALAGYLRERIEAAVPEIEHAEEMAALTASLRSDLADRELSAAERRDAIGAVTRSRAVWKAFHTPGSNPGEIAADVISDVIGDTT
jgi:siroheme synthase (precorrin-2 oxidase/ferrochelatase)